MTLWLVAYMMTNHKRKKGREATRDVNNDLTKTRNFGFSLSVFGTREREIWITKGSLPHLTFWGTDPVADRPEITLENVNILSFDVTVPFRIQQTGLPSAN